MHDELGSFMIMCNIAVTGMYFTKHNRGGKWRTANVFWGPTIHSKEGSSKEPSGFHISITAEACSNQPWTSPPLRKTINLWSFPAVGSELEVIILTILSVNEFAASNQTITPHSNDTVTLHFYFNSHK